MTFIEFGLFIIVAVVFFSAIAIRNRSIFLERENFIRRYTFSSDIFAKVKEKYPELEEKDFFLVARALRQFFVIYLRGNKQSIGMPSKVVDIMWHEFILDTRAYIAFCKKSFGGYFHHIPSSSSQNGVAIATDMKRTLRLAFLEENINPVHPTRLPLLFAIDEKLGIPEGNFYKLPKPSEVASGNGVGSCGAIACGGSSCSSGDGGGGGCGGGD